MLITSGRPRKEPRTSDGIENLRFDGQPGAPGDRTVAAEQVRAAQPADGRHRARITIGGISQTSAGSSPSRSSRLSSLIEQGPDHRAYRCSATSQRPRLGSPRRQPGARSPQRSKAFPGALIQIFPEERRGAAPRVTRRGRVVVRPGIVVEGVAGAFIDEEAERLLQVLEAHRRREARCGSGCDRAPHRWPAPAPPAPRARRAQAPARHRTERRPRAHRCSMRDSIRYRHPRRSQRRRASGPWSHAATGGRRLSSACPRDAQPRSFGRTGATPLPDPSGVPPKRESKSMPRLTKPARAARRVTSLMCSFRPRFSWMTSTAGARLARRGRAKCAKMAPVSPGNWTSRTIRSWARSGHPDVFALGARFRVLRRFLEVHRVQRRRRRGKAAGDGGNASQQLPAVERAVDVQVCELLDVRAIVVLHHKSPELKSPVIHVDPHTSAAWCADHPDHPAPMRPE